MKEDLFISLSQCLACERGGFEARRFPARVARVNTLRAQVYSERITGNKSAVKFTIRSYVHRCMTNASIIFRNVGANLAVKIQLRNKS